MKIAYLNLVHRDPQLLRRAIETLSTPQCGFFVHVDKKSDIRAFATITGSNITFCEPRIPVYWSEYTQIDATLLMLRQALASSTGYDYFVFLQGSVYPLRSGAYIQAFLEENRHFEFMNLVRMPAPGYQLHKINKLYYPSSQPIRRLGAKLLRTLGLAKRDFRQHLGKLDPYAGHACWALSREACQHILAFVTSYPHVCAYFRHTWVPEESFFHTILGNSPFHPRIRKLPVYADWSKSIGLHPAMLNDEHVAFFQAHEKVWVEDEWGSGEMLFARKFSDERLDLVDRVDEMINRKQA